jgi:N-acetylglucosamine-6-phosphate deacetylase
MSQLGSRAPGAVGAALEDRTSWCGLIVDGFHVHPAALRVALSAQGRRRSRARHGCHADGRQRRREFSLGGRQIVDQDGRLAGPDGTLAGSSLDMAAPSATRSV